MIPQGVVVTATSNHPDLVAMIQEQAQAVDPFIQAGMSPMMGSGMR